MSSFDGIEWNDPRVPAAVRRRWRRPGAGRTPIPMCDESGIYPCSNTATWWHPDVDVAFCKDCMRAYRNLTYKVHFQRLWEQEFDPIHAAVAYELREEARKKASEAEGKVVFAPRPPGVRPGR